MSARITAGVFTSHVPAMGIAIDQGRDGDAYWQPLFEKMQPARDWLAKNTPDAIVLVYNDHANAFSLDMVPTFALGTGESYAPADEGWGARPVPTVQGHSELAAHIAHSVIQQDFDLTLVNQMDVDHGLTVPLTILFGQPEEWPCKVIPLAVNVVLYPVPSGRRCLALGKAIRRAVETYDDDLDVQVWGTGGMSHQLQGPRGGLINSEFDNNYLDMIVNDPEATAAISHVDYVRQAGSEGIELVMWLIARGALGDLAGGAPPSEVHRLYHVPASNTAVGQLILEEN